jgi:hypothetical protein
MTDSKIIVAIVKSIYSLSGERVVYGDGRAISISEVLMNMGINVYVDAPNTGHRPGCGGSQCELADNLDILSREDEYGKRLTWAGTTAVPDEWDGRSWPAPGRLDDALVERAHLLVEKEVPRLLSELGG